LSNKKWQNKNKEGWFYFLKKIKLAVKCPFLPTLKKQTLGRNFALCRRATSIFLTNIAIRLTQSGYELGLLKLCASGCRHQRASLWAGRHQRSEDIVLLSN